LPLCNTYNDAHSNLLYFSSFSYREPSFDLW
jgi:hypothetical protein